MNLNSITSGIPSTATEPERSVAQECNKQYKEATKIREQTYTLGKKNPEPDKKPPYAKPSAHRQLLDVLGSYYYQL